jgi:hypothetical protein
MITKIFSKSRPMHLVISNLLVVFSFVFVFIYKKGIHSFLENSVIYLILPLILFSIFLTDFIAKKNHINKNDDYAILFYTLFLFLIPGVFLELSVVLSSVFILLATRRLVALRSHVQIKQKIIDASLWVSIAAVFEFWSILFFALIFIAVIIQVSNDFRNWIIPLIGFSAVLILFVLYALVFDFEVLDTIQDKMIIGSDLNHILNLFYSIPTATFFLFLFIVLVFQVVAVSSYLAIMQNAIKLIISMLLIGILVYVFSSEKHNGLLLYCFAPLAIIASNFISAIKKTWIKEGLVVVLLLLSVYSFWQFLIS